MSIHIGAQVGDISERVLLPGDPLRARFIADTFLEDVICYNEVRGMYGYTGNYKGKSVSIQGTGMGMPSASIYINELIDFYGARRLIRIGTCGAMQPEVKIRDIVIAMSASTNSNMNRRVFGNIDYAPTADFELLSAAYNEVRNINTDVHVGGIYTSDAFYGVDPKETERLVDYNILAVEMETAALYTIAAQKKVQALTLLTVSDSLVTQEVTSSEERQNTFLDMIKMALEVI
ncbi:MAG TPA: purine-nucleoside phosphorylase [Thermotogota bacterium]|nr:purine-nucleoside phosphorylase [Thermotogota bacterium]HPJ89433.1 purine-nucleoside phosphorylase [Thermotogota bacterium]HPR95258.1 purine-nucleoside phosphorylase [Thermotogota bacterium]